MTLARGFARGKESKMFEERDDTIKFRRDIVDRVKDEFGPEFQYSQAGPTRMPELHRLKVNPPDFLPPPKPGTFTAASDNPKGKGSGWRLEILALVVVASGFLILNLMNHMDIKDLMYEVARKKLPPAYKKDEFTELEIKNVEIINHNTRKISVAIPAGQRADLPVTSFLLIRANVDGKDVIRPYTPTSLEGESIESFDLVIKKYDNGALTPHLFSLKAGDKISVKGPIEKYPLEDRLESREDRISHICMIAGGTGITPMLQIIKHVLSLEYREAPTSLRLIFANQSEKDILLKATLDRLAQAHPSRLSIEYIIDKSHNPSWNGSVGYIDKQIIGRNFPFPGLGPTVKIFVCGPPGMMSHVCGPKAPDYSQGELGGILKELGYDSSQVYKF